MLFPVINYLKVVFLTANIGNILKIYLHAFVARPKESLNISFIFSLDGLRDLTQIRHL